MPAEKYHRSYLKEQLKAELKEQLRSDGLDPTRLPTYEYLNNKGFNTRGLTKALQRHFGDDISLHQHLRNLGFGNDPAGEWPCTHDETISHLNGFRHSREFRHGDVDDTVDSIASRMRIVLRFARDLHDTDNLLSFARFDCESEKYENNDCVEAILDTIKSEYSDGYARHTFRYFGEFYNYVESRSRIDHNPVEAVRGQYGFDSSPESGPDPLDEDQIRAIWDGLKRLPERQDLHPSVENLIEQHGLQVWRLWMMVLVVLGVGVGPRSKGYIRMDCREDWELDDDPHIRFPVRKNNPGEVPILAHKGFLEAYRDYMERENVDWNGKPFPSPQSNSGSRTKQTLNNWFKAICKEVGVRLDDGSWPTLQNLRQTWHTQYYQALRRHNVRVKIVASEAGTKDESYPDNRYIDDAEERETIRQFGNENDEAWDILQQLLEMDDEEREKFRELTKGDELDLIQKIEEMDDDELETIRDLARREFKDMLSLSELPDILTEDLDEHDYIDHQAKLSEFN